MQAKQHVYTLQEKRLLMDSLKNDEPKFLNMLKERQEQLKFPLAWRNRWSSEGLRIIYDLEMSIQENSDNTLLISAARYNRPRTVLALLQQGANVNAQGDTDFTALHLAAQKDYDQMVSMLLQNGAEVNLLNGYEDTPLHCAARNGYINTTKILVEYGASLDAKNEDGDTPGDCAEKNRDHYIRSVLQLSQDSQQPSINHEGHENNVETYLVPTYFYYSPIGSLDDPEGNSMSDSGDAPSDQEDDPDENSMSDAENFKFGGGSAGLLGRRGR